MLKIDDMLVFVGKFTEIVVELIGSKVVILVVSVEFIGKFEKFVLSKEVIMFVVIKIVGNVVFKSSGGGGGGGCGGSSVEVLAISVVMLVKVMLVVVKVEFVGKKVVKFVEFVMNSVINVVLFFGNVIVIIVVFIVESEVFSTSVVDKFEFSTVVMFIIVIVEFSKRIVVLNSVIGKIVVLAEEGVELARNLSDVKTLVV